MSKILLHACCGPCSIYPTKVFRDKKLDFKVYFYNPNIHPYKEFKQRLRTLREYCQSEKLKLIVDKSYPLEEFLQNQLAANNRCDYCYQARMQQTAQFAKENAFSSFTTTLLISPYQDHEKIVYYCKKASEQYNIDFLYEDFRPGFTKAQEMAKDMQMYRQGYCGCIFSERDRYQKVRD